MQRTPGIDMSTDSLVQEQSIATNLAFGLKLDNIDRQIYTISRDKEFQDMLGQVRILAFLKEA